MNKQRTKERYYPPTHHPMKKRQDWFPKNSTGQTPRGDGPKNNHKSVPTKRNSVAVAIAKLPLRIQSARFGCRILLPHRKFSADVCSMMAGLPSRLDMFEIFIHLYTIRCCTFRRSSVPFLLMTLHCHQSFLVIEGPSCWRSGIFPAWTFMMMKLSI